MHTFNNQKIACHSHYHLTHVLTLCCSLHKTDLFLVSTVLQPSPSKSCSGDRAQLVKFSEPEVQSKSSATDNKATSLLRHIHQNHMWNQIVGNWVLAVENTYKSLTLLAVHLTEYWEFVNHACYMLLWLHNTSTLHSEKKTQEDKRYSTTGFPTIKQNKIEEVRSGKPESLVVFQMREEHRLLSSQIASYRHTFTASGK